MRYLLMILNKLNRQSFVKCFSKYGWDQEESTIDDRTIWSLEGNFGGQLLVVPNWKYTSSSLPAYERANSIPKDSPLYDFAYKLSKEDALDRYNLTELDPISKDILEEIEMDTLDNLEYWWRDERFLNENIPGMFDLESLEVHFFREDSSYLSNALVIVDVKDIKQLSIDAEGIDIVLNNTLTSMTFKI